MKRKLYYCRKCKKPIAELFEFGKESNNVKLERVSVNFSLKKRICLKCESEEVRE